MGEGEARWRAGAGRMGLGRPPHRLCPWLCRAPCASTVPGRASAAPGRRPGQAAGRGEPRACGECSNKRFISETKAHFFEQDCLCSHLMTHRLGQGPGRVGARGGRRAGPLARSPARSPRASLSGPQHQRGALHEQSKTAPKQRRDERTPPISSTLGGGPLRAKPPSGGVTAACQTR